MTASIAPEQLAALRPEDALSLTRLLYEREREHQAIDHHSLVTYADAEGNITHANELFCRMSGYALDELLGQSHRLLRSSMHDDAFFSEMWQCLLAGDVWQGDICNRCKDGSLRWLRTTIVPFMNECGEIYQFISMRTDVSHIKAIETQLREAHKKAEKASKLKGRLLRDINHNVRTPLTSILGFAQFLEFDEQLNPEQRSYASEIIKACQHVLDLISPIAEQDDLHSQHMWTESLLPEAVSKQTKTAPQGCPTSRSASSHGHHEGKAALRYRVLFVEESSTNLPWLEQVIRRRPHVCLHTAHTAEEGLRMAETIRPALILLDSQMGEVRYHEFLQQVRQHPWGRRLPLVVISNEEMPRQALDEALYQRVEYLQRPLQVSALLRQLDKWCLTK